MAKYLVRRVETYRVDTESEAKAFIEAQKNSDEYELTKYASEHRERKVKGEIEDEWFKVVLTKDFNSEKDPITEFVEETNED